MPTLDDQLDRLSSAIRSVKASTSHILAAAPERGGPFTQAVLNAPLGDLIRDVDPSELGLFTLIPHAGNVPRDAGPSGPSEVARVEIASATPLRKQTTARQERHTKELDPEIYAIAALKYINRYGSIRSMPRAQAQATAILEQLDEIRQNISALNDALTQASAGSASDDSRPTSPKALAAEEERRIQDLQANIDQMRKRKEMLERKRTVAPPRTARPSTKSLSKGQSQEDTFWNTPGSKSAIPQLDHSLLLDERVDLGNMTNSFDSPLIHRASQFNRDALLVDEDNSPHFAKAFDEEESSMSFGANDKTVRDERGGDVHEPEEAPEDTTVILPGRPPSLPSSPPRRPDLSSREEGTFIEIELRSPPATITEATPSRKQKIRITSDVERIVAKMWSTIGDILRPGLDYDFSGDRLPRAEKTIAHLLNIVSQAPSPSSPSASSLSSISFLPADAEEVTPQQILTAQMLLALLSSPPEFALPLNKVKEALGSRPAYPGTAGVHTRVLYSCVAKKLVKIERGGGEQTVRFDIH